MSIEELGKAIIAALEANTAAVNLLEASLVGRAGGNAKPAAKEEKPKAEPDSSGNQVISAEDKAAMAAAKAAASQAAIEDAAEVEKTLEAERNATSYETLRELVLKLASGGKRDEIKAVSAKHGIAAPKDLLKDPADMSSVTDQAKLEAVYADLLALEA
jgi:hypothetical protein